MFGMESSTLVLVAIGITVAVVGGYVALARNKGAKTVGQLALKASDDADAFRDRVIAAMRDIAARNPATLKDHYFDNDDFMMDIGRLPASFTSAVMLNDAVKRNGEQPAIKYVTAENGNVNKA